MCSGGAIPSASFWGEISKPISSGYFAIHEEIASGDDRVFEPQEECTEAGTVFGLKNASNVRPYTL